MTSRQNSPNSGQGSSRSVSPERSLRNTLEEERALIIQRNLKKLASLGLQVTRPSSKPPSRPPKQRSQRGAEEGHPRPSACIATMRAATKRKAAAAEGAVRNKNVTSWGRPRAASLLEHVRRRTSSPRLWGLDYYWATWVTRPLTAALISW
ncbi:hypothetical protein VOLCADRAFT_105514 [Volvox carteri f. nagariensis]|uniref:Uncharacterized protein n=1 Tax=Volvox carteri f. nagariensis TaxID=3068 RepID=D8U1C4_VOLCA|nr:uncharacterized protein VOLCADRAFT_105514 [Volvox carteri f. nagariensis]XP_002959871.1 uncharacterized protein VOLCADRAFT_108782 [Volvox carteri f. nagariensis]EFJ39064.1 hypothetical protein VOLCADRAFT_108782 [Volvox carteri f. nagariensis]EFJ46611.1 hypothetical protein VOLCADRAFT_105514 [Volvox carteri f. nagariensis]|eukprot:XP_002952468.1 hypothetical protein VOLCADRAFT_105514 [Volvox carteri f. nagariensis]